jgi:hypothetical protein
MRGKLSRRAATVLCPFAVAVALGCDGVAAGARQTRTNPDAQVLADFQKRVESYVELHKKLQKKGASIRETADPAKIQAAQQGLAERIRAARQTAKPGDIFTPEVQKVFRRLLTPELRGSGAAETKESIKEDAPKGVPLKVNAEYPENAPLPTVPPNLLAALPKLPEQLEYRFVNRDLILRDVQANLIVDFMRNAIR